MRGLRYRGDDLPDNRARAIRSKFPRLAMVICADNDTETEAAGKGNPGLMAASKAARAVGAALAVPQFGGVAHV